VNFSVSKGAHKKSTNQRRFPLAGGTTRVMFSLVSGETLKGRSDGAAGRRQPKRARATANQWQVQTGGDGRSDSRRDGSKASGNRGFCFL
jgi:hypothetical protein